MAIKLLDIDRSEDPHDFLEAIERDKALWRRGGVRSLLRYEGLAETSRSFWVRNLGFFVDLPVFPPSLFIICV